MNIAHDSCVRKSERNFSQKYLNFLNKSDEHKITIKILEYLVESDWMSKDRKRERERERGEQEQVRFN